ncbi:TerC family protein [Symbiobacterium thermophilum]|uniref:TerC family membrane protein n=1 Tax=Symbiobacterium thermophilum (strain DSM 24528 / JCM 14929 / IAM 14863 / T) TaxID=292459 RepID=Q67T09_SYMTH|nr:TerC family protein [Symbiobacterium thermophilum]BAD39184.1 TerC family membrane protein [Symbiobacterium thermophilum IAM 14863]
MHNLELTAFFLFVIFATWLDLFVLHKDDHDIGLKEATVTSLAWILLAVLFSGYVYYRYGTEMWMQYITAYTMEKALSVDNLFVIATIFGFFGIRGGLQHRALAWGVIGAVAMRSLLIFLGVEAVERFSWLLPVFGVFLVVTGFKMLRENDEEKASLEDNKVYRLLSRVLPVYPGYDGHAVITRRNGRWELTLLGMAIVMVEATDLLFAVDSIPAVMAISQDFFIVLTSNIFAILGLRALYFLLAGILGKFRYLSLGLAFVLLFIGGKMLVLPFGIHVETWISLSVVLGTITIAILASLLIPEKTRPESAD